MRYRPADLDLDFKKFRSGDPSAIASVTSSEQTRLFDFLMRMTGQISKSYETASEAINAVTPIADESDSLADFLVVLYKTARNFTIENWNAETSRLENAAYDALGVQKDKSVSLHLALEHIVRSLPPKQREILLLRERYGFAPDEIADITGFPLFDVEETFASALGIVESALPGEAEKVPDLLIKILPFPMPIDEQIETQNLSFMFDDLRRSSRAPRRKWMRRLGVLLVLSLAIWLLMNFGLL